MSRIVLVVIGIFIISGIIYFANIQQKKGFIPANTSTTYTPIPTESTKSDLAQSGNKYSDPNGLFTIYYPTGYTLDTKDTIHPRIYKTGPTQRQQSEMSDGILIVFEAISLHGSSLESWVDKHITQNIADGTSEIINLKKATIKNAYPGFTYTLRGLGTSDILVLQKDKDSDFALVVTSAVSDPEQKNYQSELDTILSTLTLLK